MTGLPKTVFQMDTDDQYPSEKLHVHSDLACDMWQEWVLSLVFAVPAAAALISRCVLGPPLLGQ